MEVKWYPKSQDHLVILTKKSISIYFIRPDSTIIRCYQFNIYENSEFHSKSFGIKEEYRSFDFGSSETNAEDNTIFILDDSGVYSKH